MLYRTSNGQINSETKLNHGIFDFFLPISPNLVTMLLIGLIVFSLPKKSKDAKYFYKKHITLKLHHQQNLMQVNEFQLKKKHIAFNRSGSSTQKKKKNTSHLVALADH